MVSQVEVLSDREKELLSNYDRYLMKNFVSFYASQLSIRWFNTDLNPCCSRLFGFLRLQDPICDPSLPNLTHQAVLRKVRIHFSGRSQNVGQIRLRFMLA